MNGSGSGAYGSGASGSGASGSGIGEKESKTKSPKVVKTTAKTEAAQSPKVTKSKTSWPGELATHAPTDSTLSNGAKTSEISNQSEEIRVSKTGGPFTDDGFVNLEMTPGATREPGTEPNPSQNEVVSTAPVDQKSTTPEESKKPVEIPNEVEDVNAGKPLQTNSDKKEGVKTSKLKLTFTEGLIIGIVMVVLPLVVLMLFIAHLLRKRAKVDIYYA